MRKRALTLAMTLILALMMALSTTVALAGWDYEDSVSPSKDTKIKKPNHSVSVVVPVERPKKHR